MRKATFKIDKYRAVIPHIQNMYLPQKDQIMWYWGFKYKSQVFEFFYYTTLQDAKYDCERLAQAIEDYWIKK